MRKIAAAGVAFLAISVPALAQDADLQQRARSYDALRAQRNTAMDTVALCVGELQFQVDTLKKELEQAKKSCPPASQQP